MMLSVITKSKKRRLEEEARPQHQQSPPPPPTDFISHLPDDVLGTIITLLHSVAEGARTQILSRRWRPLWRSTPLNLAAKTFAAAQAILASHRDGPCHRLSLTLRESYLDFPKAADEVLRQPGADGLKELELFYFPDTVYGVIDARRRPNLNPTPPPAVSGFAPTLHVLNICCHKTTSVSGFIRSRLEFAAAEADTAGLLFPYLEQLTLKGVIIPESTLHGILSGCHALKSLVLHDIVGYDNLRISSRTLQSLDISGAHDFEGEVVIEDAPLLERLFQDGPVYRHKIRVVQAPKLKMLGYLHDSVVFESVPTPNFSFEKREELAVGLPNAIRTVKNLALDIAPDNLDTVINLTWFPCVEKLYMALGHLQYVRGKSNVVKPFVSLECLDEHLKILELKGYRGIVSEVSLVDFSLSNARVLETVKFVVPHKICYKKWLSIQRHKLRRLGPRASQGAKFYIEPEQDRRRLSSCVPIKHIHDLALDYPVDTSSSTCPHDDTTVDY